MLNMGAVLLLLIGVADGVTTFCNATQPRITTQCFGSLGGTVEVQLPAQISQNDHFRLKKNRVTILSDGYETNIRYSFNVRTGIFTIKDIDRTDNGTYSMEVHNIYGMELGITKCYLTIEAPVSSLELSRKCLSWGQQRVSASDVTLEPGRSGLLTCSVRNNVSNAAANITLSVCDGLIPFIARSLTVVVLLLAALGVYWALKKKKTSSPRDMALSSMAVDDGVLYGNVSGATGRAGGE
ncbi:unnamed protein product [Boreogadus saida]